MMMDSVPFDSFELTVNGRDLEKRFCKIYGSVFTDYFVSNKQLISNVNEILNFKKEEPNNYKNNFISYQLAFLLSFGVHDSCLAAQKFYESLVDYPEIIRRLSRNEQINICCDESESLPTAVGICHVIDQIMGQFGFSGKSCFSSSEIRVSVIDERLKWRDLCGYIVDTVNSYFKHIELKLDFVNITFKKRQSREVIDRIEQTDIMIVARVFSQWLPDQVTLEAMKENSLLFYFDFCDEPYYKMLSQTLSRAQFFSEIKSSTAQYISFEDLENGENHLDPPFKWDIDFEPVLFSIWIRQNIPQECHASIAQETISNQLNPKNSSKNSISNILLALVAHKSDTENQAKHLENLNSGNISLAFTQSDISKVKEIAKIANQPDTPNGKVNTLDTTKKMKSTKHPSISVAEATRIAFERTDESRKKKKKTKSSCKLQLLIATSDVGKTTLTDAPELKTELLKPNIVNNQIKQTNASEENKKTKSSRKSKLSTATSDVAKATLTDAPELKAKLHEPNIINISRKQTNDSKEKKTKSSNKSQLLTATSGVVTCIRQEIRSSTSFDNENEELQATKKAGKIKKNQTPPPKTPNVSAEKTVTLDVGKQAMLSKQSGKKNAVTSAMRAISSKKQNKWKNLPSKIFLKENDPTKSGIGNGTITVLQEKQRKAAGTVRLTKKISKNNDTERVKLNGKFARMDLEKKNKDESHRMKAKEKSFSKYATFDYED